MSDAEAPPAAVADMLARAHAAYEWRCRLLVTVAKLSAADQARVLAFAEALADWPISEGPLQDGA